MQPSKNQSEEYSEVEAGRRRDELAKRMLNMPPKPLKPHSGMKLGKRKAKASPKADPSKKRCP